MTGCSRRVKNRRFSKLKEYMEGGFFSDENMERYDPALFALYLGNRSSTTAATTSTKTSALVLSEYLLSRIDRMDSEKKRASVEQQWNKAAKFIPDSTCNIRSGDNNVESSRQELVGIFVQRFLNGEMLQFVDYSTIDRDLSLDDFAIEDQDAQDAYFDEE